MSKGLKVALMTVAVVMIGLKAMAIAPTIANVEDVVVGNEGTVSGPNAFTYPDAIDLNAIVTDPDTATADIKWSFTTETGKDFYQLNGINPINLTTEDPLAPGAKDISKNLATGELNADNKLYTVTIRNKHLSPLTGTGATPGTDDATTKVITAETAMMTLFASDGTTFTTGKPFTVYTDNGGSDRLYNGIQWTTVSNTNFNGNTGGFTYTSYSLGGASGTNGGTAICLNCNSADNYAEWNTAYGLFTPVKNAVYRLRVVMNSDQAATNETNQIPLWDILLDNSTGTGSNLFYFDSLIFDNFGGGGNTILSSAPKTFDFYWTPASVNSTKWNDATSGAFIAANATKIQTRLTFRVLDVTANKGIHAATAKGNLCLDNLQIDRVDIASLAADGAPVYNPTISATTVTTSSVMGYTGANAATVSYAGGVMTLQPQGSSLTAEYAQLVPGDVITAADQLNPANGNMLDNYPVAWTDNAVFKVTFGLASTNASSPGFLCFGMDSMDSGLISLNYITNQLSGAMMPTTTAQDYVTFCGVGLSSPNALYKHLRPRLELGNNAGINGTGGIKVSSIKVEKVKVGN